ncbi:TonB-dependent receptor [Actomonas aquatica]|uniref:TonB-dependent receptor n=1 Tax=Actomonas aquatica TaxID=2866162 RepID=A0ABZ1C5C7_9BACT|nr:TonB-dependent receptor [Opitutus sp. WL0086]WRQ86860.1 TonB-dependent receptor [Opitutus sp. WL0086]
MSLSFRLLLGSALASCAFAQTTLPPSAAADNHTVHLGDFVVSTHPYARSQSEIAQPTTVIGDETVRRDQAATLGELLANQPGVSSTYFGPGSSRPVIRALGGPRVAVLQNGTDTIDASVISPDHAVSLDPLLIERVEVTRGPAALLQGGSAIGGAVNVVTHRIHTTAPEPGIHGRTEGRYATGNDERAFGLVIEGSSGALAWHVDAFDRRSGDVEIPGYAESARLRAEEEAEHDHDDEDHDEEDHDDHDEEEEAEAYGHVPNSYVDSTGGALGLSWVGDRGYLGFAYSGFDTLYGIPPGAHSHEHHEDEDHEEEDHDDEDHDEHEHGEELVSVDLSQRRFELEGELRDPFAALRALRFRAVHADYEHRELEGDEIGTTFTNRGYDLRLDALHQPWGGLQGAVGAKFGESEFDAVGAEAFLPAYRTREFALFAFEEVEAGPTLWQFGARWDHTGIDVEDGSGRRASEDAVSGSLGWVQKLNESWTVAASLAHTERTPSAQELYADGPHIGTNAYELGDANLGHEISHGLDLSLRHRGELFSSELTVFLNHFDGYIYENPTGAEADGLPVYAFVQRDADFHGAEFTTTIHLHEDQHGHLDLSLSGDFVRARNTSDRTDLPRTTPTRLRAGLDWSLHQWRAGADVSHVFEQDRTAPGETTTDAYTLVGLYGGYRWVTSAVTWDLLLRGSNLTDEEARVHTSFLKEVVPLPGRNLSLSLRASF